MNKKLLAVAALALVSLTAQAHRGWLLPSAGAIEGDNLRPLEAGHVEQTIYQRGHPRCRIAHRQHQFALFFAQWRFGQLHGVGQSDQRGERGAQVMRDGR